MNFPNTRTLRDPYVRGGPCRVARSCPESTRSPAEITDTLSAGGTAPSNICFGPTRFETHSSLYQNSQKPITGAWRFSVSSGEYVSSNSSIGESDFTKKHHSNFEHFLLSELLHVHFDVPLRFESIYVIVHCDVVSCFWRE